MEMPAQHRLATLRVMNTPTATLADPFAAMPLAGCVVAITADRRREEFTALLERRGARVIATPTMRIKPIEDDAPLRAATESCLAAPLDYVVATTGIGWRGWMSVAEGWGLDQALIETCSKAAVLTRGPKATGAVRACGLHETYSSPSEEVREILDWLLARQLPGLRVAVQRHGTYDSTFIDALRDAGAEVVDIPVYRWGPPIDPAAVDRLVESIARHEVHAVAFTSAPGAAALLEAADASGRGEQVRAAFADPVLAACVGEVCARPFAAEGLPSVWPDRGRLGSLVKVLTDELPARLRSTISTSHGDMVVQGNAVAVGETIYLLAPQPAAMLRELCRAPGRVVSRSELLRRVWGRRGDAHIVEVTVARLRTALSEHAPLVVTVPKRGYLIATNPRA
jgi:uroporphyrinogen-III synthase